MDRLTLDILNKMYDTISSMGTVLNEVSSYNCHGREKMNKQWSELRQSMAELNKPPAEITADMVRRLREHSGEGLMACKQALVKCNGNFNLAAIYLHNMGNI